MTIFVQSFGVGPDVVVLHGWGFHGGVWEDLADTIAGWGHRLHIVDLPGHGHSPPFGAPQSAEDLAHAIRAVVPAGATWVGWSLGGVIALTAAISYPTEVRSLVLMATSPKFVRAPDWPAAIDPDVLAEFSAGLQVDWRATLARFLAIQARASTGQTIRHLRTILFRLPPHPDALANGLRVLQETDLRMRLSAVVCPTLVLLGERDTLVPVEVAVSLAQLRPDWRIHCLAGAGHAPFLTHRAEVLSFLAEHWSHAPEWPAVVQAANAPLPGVPN